METEVIVRAQYLPFARNWIEFSRVYLPHMLRKNDKVPRVIIESKTMEKDSLDCGFTYLFNDAICQIPLG